MIKFNDKSDSGLNINTLNVKAIHFDKSCLKKGNNDYTSMFYSDWLIKCNCISWMLAHHNWWWFRIVVNSGSLKSTCSKTQAGSLNAPSNWFTVSESRT